VVDTTFLNLTFAWMRFDEGKRALQMRILLARHGETKWNTEGRYQGQGFDIALSPAGLSQAEALASRLAGFELTRIVASPLLRARQTAEIVRGDRSAPLTLDPDLMEMAHGDWEGLLDEEVKQRDEAHRRAWRETPHLVAIPGGESLEQVLSRAWRALHKACHGLQSEETLFMVSHDAVNRVLLCRILGLNLARVWAFRQAPTCLNLLEGPDPEQLSLVRLNDASHLMPLFGEVVHRRL
jgi:phosphoserine phosphatase